MIALDLSRLKLKIEKIFFENLYFKQTIFKNIFWLGLTEGVVNILKFFLFVYIARLLGATKYGKFSFALSFVNLFVVILDFGLSTIIIREFSKNKENEKEIFSLFSLKIFLSIFVFLLIFFTSFFITPEKEIKKIIWILSFLVIAESFLNTFFAFFRSRQKMEYEAGFKILEMVLITGFVFLSLFYFPSTLNLSISYALGALLSLFLILIFFHFKILNFHLKIETESWKRYLTLAWPLALTSFFTSIFNNADSVLMGYLKMLTETGWYNAAKRIAFATTIPCVLFSVSFFPALNFLFHHFPQKFRKIWLLFLKIILIFSIPIFFGALAFSFQIIDLVYDPSFFPTNFAFCALMGMVTVNNFSAPFYLLLIILNKQKKIFFAIFWSTILNLFLNILLVPRYSLNGAAISSLIGTLAFFFLILKYLKKAFPLKLEYSRLLGTIGGIILSIFLMFVFLFLLPFKGFHILSIILIGAFIYFLSFLLYNFLIKFFLKINLF